MRTASPRPRGITLAPPQRAPQTRNKDGSWWLEAKRDGFTATALDHLPKETLSAGASMALSPWPRSQGQED